MPTQLLKQWVDMMFHRNGETNDFLSDHPTHTREMPIAIAVKAFALLFLRR